MLIKKNSILPVFENADLANVKVNVVRLTPLEIPASKAFVVWRNDITKMKILTPPVKKYGKQKGSNQAPFGVVNLYP